jgi:translation initiation factor 1
MSSMWHCIWTRFDHHEHNTDPAFPCPVKPRAKTVTDRLVYSTDQGRMCPDCRQPAAKCTCKRSTAVSESTGVVRVSRESKGRKGKEVTLVQGVDLDTDALVQLGKSLKKHCGTGGTVKDGTIELQGDHVTRVVEQLKNQGWLVKRVGG